MKSLFLKSFIAFQFSPVTIYQSSITITSRNWRDCSAKQPTFCCLFRPTFLEFAKIMPPIVVDNRHQWLPAMCRREQKCILASKWKSILRPKIHQNLFWLRELVSYDCRLWGGGQERYHSFIIITNPVRSNLAAQSLSCYKQIQITLKNEHWSYPKI